MAYANRIRIMASLCTMLLLMHFVLASSITQASYKKDPLITRTPSVTPTRTPTGSIGWRSIHGQVLNAAATPQPISSAQISLRHSSRYTASSQMTVTSDVSGLYSFEPLYIMESDWVKVHAEAHGYIPQEESRNGIQVYFDSIFNFKLLWSKTFYLPTIFK